MKLLSLTGNGTLRFVWFIIDCFVNIGISAKFNSGFLALHASPWKCREYNKKPKQMMSIKINQKMFEP